MNDLNGLIQRAQRGELEAYDRAVRQFQDMAVGYSYSLLHDFHWAQDAAQEAFFQAFLDLPTLKEPLGFPGWFRKIVFKQCDRLTRHKQVLTVSLETAQEIVCTAAGPAQAAEEAETSAYVHAEVARLPEKEREVITLFYLGGHSQEEIGEFLELPVNTVKKRLQTARQRLKGRMIAMVQDDLQQQAPSRNARFADEIAAALRHFHAPNPDHDIGLMPWVRLYRTFEEAATAGRSVSDVERAVFNALLRHTQELLPGDAILQAVPEALPQDTAETLRLSAQVTNHATCRDVILSHKNVLREAHVFRNELTKMAHAHPERPAPENAVLIFNALLQKVQARYPDDASLQIIPQGGQGRSVGEMEEAANQIVRVMEDARKTMSEEEREQPF